MEKDLTVIPKGMYCYTIDDEGAGHRGGLKIKLCPYWSIIENKPTQMNGYCAYLDVGDWEMSSSFGLLWDQVKLCDIFMDFDDEDEINI